MSKISYNPASANRAFLPQAGLYGPGCENEADVTVYSVALAAPDSIDAPFDDKHCERDSYTIWTFQVAFGGSMLFARSRAQANTLPNMGSKNIAWFQNLGVMGETMADGSVEFDPQIAVGKKCRIRVAKPRADKQDPSVWYTGAVVDVFGLDQQTGGRA